MTDEERAEMNLEVARCVDERVNGILIHSGFFRYLGAQSMQSLVGGHPADSHHVKLGSMKVTEEARSAGKQVAQQARQLGLSTDTAMWMGVLAALQAESQPAAGVVDKMTELMGYLRSQIE